MLGLSLCIIFCISYPENSNSRAKDSVSRISHFECFNIVRLIEHEIRKVEGPLRYRFLPAPAQPVNGNSANSNSTSAQQSQTGQTERKKADLSTIIQELSKNCDSLPDTRQAVCKDVLREDNVKKVYDFIKEGKRPDFICSSIGYKRATPSRSRLINRKVCTQVVDLIKNDFNRSITPIFGNRRFGFPGSNTAAKTNVSSTASQAKLLVDQQVTNSSAKQTTTSASNSSLPNKGMFSHMNRFTSFFTRKGPRVCKQFAETPNYQQCLILSRIAIRAARPQIKAGNSSESICNFLGESNLIQLTDEDVGTIAQENDMEQIRRNQRRSGFLRRDDDENAPIRRNHNRFDDENSSTRRSHNRFVDENSSTRGKHNRPDDENAPLKRNDRKIDQSRPKIENNNN